MQAFEVRFHQVLCDLIARERNNEAKHLSEGVAKDFADYRHRVGILEGLKRARELANSLLEDAREGERNVEQMAEEMHKRETWQH